MIELVTTASGLSPEDEEKKELKERVKMYENFVEHLIDKADIVQYNPRKNTIVVFVSKYSPFFIEIPHFIETKRIWEYGKSVVDYRLNNHEEETEK